MASTTFLGIKLTEWFSFGVVTVLVNLSLTSISLLLRNRWKALRLLAAIEFECKFASQLCTAYKRDSRDGTRAWAPAYRLSVKALEEGVPWLRDHGFLFVSEADELVRLCLRMSEVNHCLNLVEEGVKQHGGNEDTAHFFYSRQSIRCAGKCDHVLQPQLPEHGDGTLPGATVVLAAARYRIRFWLRPIWLHREKPIGQYG